MNKMDTTGLSDAAVLLLKRLIPLGEEVIEEVQRCASGSINPPPKDLMAMHVAILDLLSLVERREFDFIFWKAKLEPIG